jgi:hypothetical protein
MPKKNAIEVAKEILEINPEQWIIFASAYVKETLEKFCRGIGGRGRAIAKALFSVCISRHSGK